MATNLPEAILNELLALEERSLPARVLESTVFVSQASAENALLVRRMADAQREHGAWLTQAILDHDGVPGPRREDAASGDLHFLHVHRLLPRLAADRESLLAKYALAAQRLSAWPDLAALVARIRDRHREELAALTEMA